MTGTTTQRFTAVRPAGVGFLGAGNILPAYLRGIARDPRMQVIGCAARSAESARAAAAKYGTNSAGLRAFDSIEQLLVSDEVDIIVNITAPTAHADTTEAALRAGKHVYVEKPITTDPDRARALAVLAADHGLVLGAAPDTSLGSAVRTAAQAIARGEIGDVIGVSGFICHGGAETWHPNPGFLFSSGGGPVADMAPYYLTALISCVGPVRSVVARGRIGERVRTVSHPYAVVDRVEVTIPTHVVATLEFVGGALGHLQASFEIWPPERALPYLQIYGTRGSLDLPDPNHYDGQVRLRRHGDAGWQVIDPVIPPITADGEYLRGPGVSDLVDRLGGGTQQTTAGLATHVLDIVFAVEKSCRTGASVDIEPHCWATRA